MGLAVGIKLTHYEILELLGAGAMGEVYRARDTRLRRDVAIKVLPPQLASEPERLARFQREALALAAVSHANIAQIHGTDCAGGVNFLALELVRGQTLDERLQRGPLRLDEAIEVGCQMAAGLAAAHDAGVVHRDLKPANVMVTPEGTVKLLDFGLATAGAAEASDPLATRPGSLIGTPAYMAPEQARGQPADRRADLWAFGCLLYECITGTRPFAGTTLTEVLAAVLERDVDWSALPAATPQRLRDLMARCLVKDPHRRWRDAGDASLELEAARLERPARRGGVARGWLLAAAAAGAVITGVGSRVLQPPGAGALPALRRFALHGTNISIDSVQGLALSPDGRQLVYRGKDAAEQPQLFWRAPDALVATPLPGTRQGYLPFFSPDGRELGFGLLHELVALTLETGAIRKIADLPHGYSGGAWLPNGSIVWTEADGRRLWRVDAPGGEPRPEEFAGVEDGDTLIGPSALPGSGAVLCTQHAGATHLEAVVLDLERNTLAKVADGFTPIYAAGYVLHQNVDGPLMAIAFDAHRLVATGQAFSVVADLGTRVSTHVRMFAIAGDGTLAYVPARAFEQRSGMVIVDRAGKTSETLEVGRILDNPRFSADGSRIAFRTPGPTCFLWVRDDRGVTTRITQEGDSHGNVWLPDDRRIAFLRPVRPPFLGLFAADAGGAGQPEELLRVTGLPRGFAASCSPDGRQLLLGTQTYFGADVFLADVDARSATPLLHSPHNERAASFSPDGKRIAYVSDEEGREDVFVKPLSALDRRTKVSVDGGRDPVWSRDGKELFFLAGRTMMVADIDVSSAHAPGKPKPLFEASFVEVWNSGLPSYDVSPDGQRFVMARQRSSADSVEIHVVLHWLDELRRSDPGAGGR